MNDNGVAENWLKIQEVSYEISFDIMVIHTRSTSKTTTNPYTTAGMGPSKAQIGGSPLCSSDRKQNGAVRAAPALRSCVTFRVMRAARLAAVATMTIQEETVLTFFWLWETC
jgi:hypothetical protein